MNNEGAVQRTARQVLAVALTSVSVLASITGCGSNTGEDDPVPIVVYDEEVDGPLPYTLDGLSAEEVARYTFPVERGDYVVRGTSTDGERFRLSIPTGLYLRTIEVTFYTHIDDNDKVVAISDEGGTQVLWDAHDLPTAGTYTYSIQVPHTSIGNGTFEVYSGTSVQGASNENPFSLSFRVVRR